MQDAQPQLYTIPIETLSRVVNFLGEMPFKEVAPLLTMIDQTVKEYSNGTGEGPIGKRNGRKSKSAR